ncbi:STAS domain-containing protein [Psychromarinibacter halotolerans]|uniref:Anti-sigma factor antagonist n=1 Tax=Psychromarinibacter halotolerans TaxID=1775175 RepID=A0ABV7H3T5_9RHOB|nr:STAS domain-containing protein [Psychromarinibacter halotolerans]MDF0598803.1 STAS domain-containing protein [Psychromarinibacter halotolerans]
MQLEAEDRDGVRIVRATQPRLDAVVAVQFKDAFRDVTADAQNRVVLDLSAVEFLDSSGLGAIVAAMKHLAPDRRLELAGLGPIVTKVFSLTRMDTVFAIHADVEQALAAPADAP